MWVTALLVLCLIAACAIVFRIQEGISFHERLLDAESLLALTMLFCSLGLSFYVSPHPRVEWGIGTPRYFWTIFAMLPALGFCLVSMPELAPTRRSMSGLRTTRVVGWLLLAGVFVTAVIRHIHLSISS